MAAPRQSLPDWAHLRMQGASTLHFAAMAQAVLYRGAGFEVVWPQFAALAALGGVLFMLSLACFRRVLASLG